MLACRICRQLTVPYTEGALPEPVRSRLSRHISSCEACESELREFQRTIRAIRQATPELPSINPDLWQTLEPRLRAIARPRRRPVPWSRWTPALGGALAAAAAFALFFAYPRPEPGANLEPSPGVAKSIEAAPHHASPSVGAIAAARLAPDETQESVAAPPVETHRNQRAASGPAGLSGSPSPGTMTVQVPLPQSSPPSTLVDPNAFGVPPSTRRSDPADSGARILKFAAPTRVGHLATTGQSPDLGEQGVSATGSEPAAPRPDAIARASSPDSMEPLQPAAGAAHARGPAGWPGNAAGGGMTGGGMGGASTESPDPSATLQPHTGKPAVLDNGNGMVLSPHHELPPVADTDAGVDSETPPDHATVTESVIAYAAARGPASAPEETYRGLYSRAGAELYARVIGQIMVQVRQGRRDLEPGRLQVLMGHAQRLRQMADRREAIHDEIQRLQASNDRLEPQYAGYLKGRIASLQRELASLQPPARP